MEKRAKDVNKIEEETKGQKYIINQEKNEISSVFQET